jgi:hypothetical protein
MALHARKRLTKWLMRRLGRDRSLTEHAAAAGITVAQYAFARVAARPPRRQVPADVADWLKEIEHSGYCVVPAFFDSAICAQCVAELERLFAEYPDYVQRKSDSRIFGVEAASPLLGSFGEEPRLSLAAECMLRDVTINAFTLGARIDEAPGNKGSGEGWHRDSFVVQFKAILYLSDVEADNGPFQLIADSEKLPRLVADMLQARLGLSQNRVDDAQVARLLARDPSRLRTFIAKAGTLLLVNTSAIHRGQPIERGSRYALTNYYVQRSRAGAAMDAHFAPVLRKAGVARAAARPETVQSAR